MSRVRWIIWLAVAIHAWWGWLLLTAGDTVTGITAIHHTTTLGFNAAGLGLVYLIVAGLATAGMILQLWEGGKGWALFVELLAVLPQQFLLMYSAWGAVIAIDASAFADGVVRARSFIAADQCPAIFLAILHTCAIVEPHVARLWIGVKS